MKPSRTESSLGLAITLLTAAFLIGPVIMSILTGLTRNAFIGLSSGLTVQWIVQVWGLYSGTVWRSLAVAVATLIVTVLVGVPAAWTLACHPGKRARAFEELIGLPVAVPGLASALALIISWGTVRGLRGSIWFIVIGHVLFTLPFMISATRASMRADDLRTLDEAGATLGASRVRRFLDVIVPNAAPGILSGALSVFTLSIGEFNLTWLLHTPLTETLPVGLADAYASARLEVGSAYTIVFLLMVLPLLVALQWFGERAGKKKKEKGPHATRLAPPAAQPPLVSHPSRGTHS